MKPLDSELRVIAAAEERARSLGADPNHSVAAAAMDTTGRIHTAVNVAHFTGGVCAELVALGAAASAGAGPLLTIAAASARGRGTLIPPCGRCRQVMLDLHPDVLVAVPTDDGPAMRPIRKLLPDTHFFPGADARRVVRFNKQYYEPVVSREKTVTIRWDDPMTIGPAIFVFEDHPDNARIDGVVVTIERHRLDSLTAGQAKMPDDADVAALISGLKSHYPDLPPNAMVDVVTFTTAQRP